MSCNCGFFKNEITIHSYFCAFIKRLSQQLSPQLWALSLKVTAVTLLRPLCCLSAEELLMEYAHASAMQTLSTRLLQRGWSVLLLFYRTAFPVLLGTRGLPVPSLDEHIEGWCHMKRSLTTSILQKNKQTLLWPMLLQSSQNLPASKLSPADDTDPTSRGLNPSVKPLKTEMVEKNLRKFLSWDKKWGWHKGHVAYKGILGEIFIEAGFQGPWLRPVYINFHIY